MTRRPSHPSKTYTSYEYNQIVVPLVSEMSRAKQLRAESNVLMEKTLSNLNRFQSSYGPSDCRSLSLDSISPRSTTPQVELPQNSMRSQSLDQTEDISFPQSPINVRLKRILTPSNPSGVTLASLTEYPRTRNDTITIVPRIESGTQLVKVKPLIKHLDPTLLPDDPCDRSPSPEESYAEYLRMHKPLPQLRSSPSASLLHGTVATSSRIQGIFVSPTKEKLNFASRFEVPSTGIIQETTTVLKKKKKKATACPVNNAYHSPMLTATRCTSPSDGYSPSTMLYKRRHSTGTPTPIACNHVPHPLNISTERVSSTRRHSASNTKMFSTTYTSPSSTSRPFPDDPLMRLNVRARLQTPNRTAHELLGSEVILVLDSKITNDQSHKAIQLTQEQKEKIVDCWQNILDLPVAHTVPEELFSQRQDDDKILPDDKMKQNNAARMIVGLFLRPRCKKFKSLKPSNTSEVSNISRFHSIVSYIGRKRKATLCLKEFLQACSIFKRPTRGFSAGKILRFVKSVRVIQCAYRAFRTVKRKHIAGLMKVWESYESKHISHMFKTVQDKYRESLTSSHILVYKDNSRRNSAPPPAYISPTLTSESLRRNSHPDARPLSPYLSTSQSDNATYSLWAKNGAGNDVRLLPPRLPTFEEISIGRYTASNMIWQERKWSQTENKFTTLFTRFDRKRTEKEIIIANRLSIEDKKYLLNEIYKEAARRRIEKYDNSLRLQQKALERNDLFTIADAMTLIKDTDNRALMSLVKHKIQQVDLYSGASDSRKKCLPFIFYTSAIHDDIVYRCIREAHKEKMTYKFIYEHYCCFH